MFLRLELLVFLLEISLYFEEFAVELGVPGRGLHIGLVMKVLHGSLFKSNIF